MQFKLSFVRPVLGALVTLVAIGPASAVTIFDNGGPDQVSGNEMTHWVQTEDFVLTTDSYLTDAHFWSVEGGSWDGTLDYFLFADAGGVPAAAPFATGSAVNVSKVATGNVLFFGSEYEYSFDLASPIPLSGGTTYWFGLHLSNNFDRDEIYWETTNVGLGASGSTGVESEGGTFGNWFDNAQHHAFYLTGRAIPEPTSLALAGVSLMGVLGCTRRGRRA
jgi:hypothetical protein